MNGRYRVIISFARGKGNCVEPVHAMFHFDQGDENSPELPLEVNGQKVISREFSNWIPLGAKITWSEKEQQKRSSLPSVSALSPEVPRSATLQD